MSMIKEVTAYEDSDGKVHKTREDVVHSELNMLFNNDATHSEIVRILKHRVAIVSLLSMVGE